MEFFQALQFHRPELFSLLQGFQIFLGDRVIVIQVHVVADNIVIAFFIDTVAEIHVGKAVGEICFIESADLEEHFPADHHAGSRDGKDIAHALVKAVIPDLFVAPVLELVDRFPPDGKDSGMLDDVGAGIQKLHTDRSDIGKLGFLGEVGQPSGLADHDIVMQEQEHLAVGAGRADIVEPGHVERHLLIKIDRCQISLIDLVNKPLDTLPVLRIASVVHNDDLIGDARVLDDRTDALLEDLRIVLAGDDDADQSGRRGLLTEPPGQGFPEQVRVPGLRFVRRMEQDLRNMSDRHLLAAAPGKAAVSLGQLEAELAIDPCAQSRVRLRPPRFLLLHCILQDRRFRFKLRRSPLAGVEQGQDRGTDRKNAPEIEGRQKSIRGPVRFKPGTDMGAAGDLVFVPIHHIDPGVQGEEITDHPQRIFRELPVVIAGNQNIRLFLSGQYIILQMRIAHDPGRKLRPRFLFLCGQLRCKLLLVKEKPLVIRFCLHEITTPCRCERTRCRPPYDFCPPVPDPVTPEAAVSFFYIFLFFIAQYP